MLQRWMRAALFALLAVPVVAAAQVAYVGSDVNMRAGPDAGYPLVSWLPAGSTINVYGCVDGYSWCDVAAANGVRGWVNAAYINYPYQSSQVPIYSYGPQLNIPLVTFSIGTYWGNYYVGRPWYSNRNYWYGYRPPPPRPGYGPGYPGYRPPPGPGYRPPGYRAPPPGNGGRPPPHNGSRPPPGGKPPPGAGNGGRPPGPGAGNGGRPPGSGAGNGGRPPGPGAGNGGRPPGQGGGNGGRPPGGGGNGGGRPPGGGGGSPGGGPPPQPR